MFKLLIKQVQVQTRVYKFTSYTAQIHVITTTKSLIIHSTHNNVHKNEQLLNTQPHRYKTRDLKKHDRVNIT